MNLYRAHLEKGDKESFFYVEANSEEEAIAEAEKQNRGWKVCRRDEVPEIELLGRVE